MFTTYTIHFSNREQFEKAHEIICHYNTRLSSAGDLDFGYADMIVTFSDKYHYLNAIKRLKDKKIVDFE